MPVMTRALWFPGADRSQDRSRFSGVTMPAITKCVLHSTETRGWPGYPDFAPQITLDPWALQVRQHMPINRSASTLADPSSTAVRENRDDVAQIEIVGYCDESKWPLYGKSTEAIPPAGLRLIAKVIAWLHTEWGLPLEALPADKWKSYRFGRVGGSYGLDNGVRLTGPGYDAFRGVLGHQHASGNTHGDPGHIDIDAIMAAVRQIVTPEAPEGGEIDMASIRDFWQWDGIPSPTRNAENPFWRPVTYVRETYLAIKSIEKKLDTLIKLVKDL